MKIKKGNKNKMNSRAKSYLSIIIEQKERE